MNETPIKIRLPRRVNAGFFPGHADPGVYEAQFNRNGAISVIDSTGEPFGIRPGEFEFCSLDDQAEYARRFGNDTLVKVCDPAALIDRTQAELRTALLLMATTDSGVYWRNGGHWAPPGIDFEAWKRAACLLAGLPESMFPQDPDDFDHEVAEAMLRGER